MSKTYKIHVPIHIQDKFLVDLPILKIAEFKEVGELVGLSSYIHQTLTATIKLSSGALFYDIPLHSLDLESIWTEDQYPQDPSWNCPFNCPGEEVVAFGQFPQNTTVSIFNPSKNHIGYGRYLLSLDWPEHNWLAHIVVSPKSGRIYALPNFLVLFKKEESLPEHYKKIRSVYIATQP